MRPGSCSGSASPRSCSAGRRRTTSGPPHVPERPGPRGVTRARIVLVGDEEERVAEREGRRAAGGRPGQDGRALHVVGAGDAYGDWEELYADNVVRLYRLLYSNVGNRPD